MGVTVHNVRVYRDMTFLEDDTSFVIEEESAH